MKQTAGLCLVSALVVLSIWYLIAPPRSASGYRDRAAKAVATVRSQVQTARLWVHTVGEQRALHATATVGLEEADADAATAANSFEALDPPQGTDNVRAEVLRVAGAAQDVLGALRVAAHRDAWSEVRASAEALPGLARRLGAVERRLRA